MYVEKQIHSGCMVEKIKRRKINRNERPRRKKEKMSSDDQKRRNEVNRKNRLLREISANFENGDLFVSLNAKDDMTLEETNKRFKQFIRTLKKQCTEANVYIKVVEEGEKSGKHHIHLLLKGSITLEMLTKAWKWGSVNVKPIYSAPDFEQIAEYLLKKHRPEGAKAWTSGRANKKPIEKEKKVKSNYFRKAPSEEIRVGKNVYKLHKWDEHIDSFTLEVVQHAIYLLGGNNEHSQRICRKIIQSDGKRRKNTSAGSM